MVQQKIVIKVDMHCDKCRSKAMKIAAVAHGVNSVKIEGGDKDKVVVTGDGIDAACLTRSLRKKVGHATLVSVEVLKPQDSEAGQKPEKVHIQWPSGYCCQYQYPQLYLCEPVSDPGPPPCSIM
ncbi:hypothetical protein RJ640_004927 [Escallonia rubra]|uniref:HMA domain-containing protein n=1 Tax=Escallonia rubra TaxID=112253 RepID=A0AA88RAL1_9ASTE|nr:hypothetical protein RJ640_001933 [Escallonia rubra]KAK2986966.1 hypothetical protein RJ640_004927 [Escallonia rubra]